MIGFHLELGPIRTHTMFQKESSTVSQFWSRIKNGKSLKVLKLMLIKELEWTKPPKSSSMKEKPSKAFLKFDYILFGKTFDKFNGLPLLQIKTDYRLIII